MGRVISRTECFTEPLRVVWFSEVVDQIDSQIYKPLNVRLKRDAVVQRIKYSPCDLRFYYVLAL